MPDDDSWVSIAEAAGTVDVSRRTIERWLRDGRLVSRESGADRRLRLVRLADASRLAATSARGRHGRPPKTPPAGLNDPVAALQVDERGALPPYDQDVVDELLQVVYRHHHFLASGLFPTAFRPLVLRDLRGGPLGQNLSYLARYARGEVGAPGGRIRAGVESVLQLLLWPAAADDYHVPPAFWDTSAGRMLMAARYRSYPRDELISVAGAAERLGVGRATIFRWMDDRTLDYVRDDLSGRIFVARRDVENALRRAKELVLEECAGGSTVDTVAGPVELAQTRGRDGE
jgi:excisionase family DNA binding protein